MANSGRCAVCHKTDSDGDHFRVGVTYQMGDGFHKFEPEPISGEASPADIHKMAMAQQDRVERDKAKELGVDVDEMRKSAGEASTGEQPPRRPCINHSEYSEVCPDCWRETNMAASPVSVTEESAGPRIIKPGDPLPSPDREYYADAAPSLTPRCPKCGSDMENVVYAIGEDCESVTHYQVACIKRRHVFEIRYHFTLADFAQFFSAQKEPSRSCPKCGNKVCAPYKSTETGLWTQRCNKCEWFDSWAGAQKEAGQ